MRLTLQDGAGLAPGCAAEAALRLAEAEPLLAALEAWWGENLEWNWDADATSSASEAKAQWTGPGLTARLDLPWALLRQRPAPMGELAAMLRWAPATAHVVLAALDPSPAEEALLEPGGVLLLPASFEPAWRVELRAEGEPEGMALSIERPEQPAWKPAPAQRVRGSWEVRCEMTAVDAEVLAGWRAPDGGVRLPAEGGATLWETPAGEPARRRATGRLLPWGCGNALWIDAE